MAADLPEAEKRLASSLVKRDAFDLSKTLLAVARREDWPTSSSAWACSAWVFRAIIILMLINGFAVCEMFGQAAGRLAARHRLSGRGHRGRHVVG